MKRLSFFATLFFILVFPLLAENTWLLNFEEAQAKAKDGNKRILVLFTGSDWCGWCIKLENEILGTQEFQSYAQKQLILVKMDFPQSIPMSQSQKAYNESLARKYGVQGFPTVLVFNAEGKLLTQAGYMPGGPLAFIRQLGDASPASESGNNLLDIGTVNTDNLTTPSIVAGLIVILIIVGYLLVQNLRNATPDLPDPRKYRVEFLGSLEEFTLDKHEIIISGIRYSLAGSAYDEEASTLLLKSGTTIRFVPKDKEENS